MFNLSNYLWLVFSSYLDCILWYKFGFIHFFQTLPSTKSNFPYFLEKSILFSSLQNGSLLVLSTLLLVFFLLFLIVIAFIYKAVVWSSFYGLGFRTSGFLTLLSTLRTHNNRFGILFFLLLEPVLQVQFGILLTKPHQVFNFRRSEL